MKRVTIIAIAGIFLAAACLLIGPGCSKDSATSPVSTASQQVVVGDIDYSDGYPFGVWQDGFEVYDAGTWPSTWIAEGNAPGAQNCVDNSVAFEGEKSLHLYGVTFGAWAGCAYRALEVEPPYEIRVAVYNGNEPIGGTVQPARGHIGILAGTNWWDPWRTLVVFNRYNEIISSGGMVLGTYNNLQWYQVRIRYERPNAEEVFIRYWIDNKCIGTETLPIRTGEDNMVTVTLEALEGSAWFDNVEICSRP